jgi:hypothetical protein
MTELPKMEGVFSPCDPNGWEIIETSAADKAKADILWTAMSAMGMPFTYHNYR